MALRPTDFSLARPASASPALHAQVAHFQHTSVDLLHRDSSPALAAVEQQPFSELRTRLPPYLQKLQKSSSTCFRLTFNSKVADEALKQAVLGRVKRRIVWDDIQVRVNIQIQWMDYFPIYIETIAEAFRRVRKISFKKIGQIRDLLDLAEGFLSKEVYGRIEPSNYLLAMIVVLGSRTPKLYAPIISAVQRLFSYNFIAASEDLSSSVKYLREEHREFLLLPLEDYGTRSFKEVYVETLVSLGGDEGLTLNVAKSLSLIWRLDQNSLPRSLLPKIYDYLLDCMAANKLEDDQRMLKSVLLEMFRHALESYREAHDRKFLHEDNCVSLKGVCSKYTMVLADTVALRLDVQQRYGVQDYAVIPLEQPGRTFQLRASQEVNQKGQLAGKFGWCTSCRLPANYFCIATRLPVCSFECKQSLLNELQSLEKFTSQQQRSSEVFESHLIGLFALFRKYLSHTDMRKRVCFSEVLILMASEIKKVADRLSPPAYLQLRGVVRQVLVNVCAESQAFPACMATLKKLLQLRIFRSETELTLRLFARKLTYFLTAPTVRDEILKFLRDFTNNRLLFDAAVALDCSPHHYDAVREVVDAVRTVYLGLPLPEAIALPPPEDIAAKRLALDVALNLLRHLQETQRRLPPAETERMVSEKNKLNVKRANIQRFNKSEKPTKVLKKLVEEGFLPATPAEIARYLHNNLRRLNPTNVGQLIGDYDELAGQIRHHFISQIDFSNRNVDQGLRELLRHFTLPGESQVVERIVETFGIVYFQQNRSGGVLVNSDAVYSLSYLIMMLQSNVHNPQVVDKMTLPQFSKLSKGMNGSPDAEFPPDYLEAIFTSVQRTPLAVHEKLKQIQITIAYNSNPRRAQQIYLKEFERDAAEGMEPLEEGPPQLLPELPLYPLPIFVEEFAGQVLDMLAARMREVEERQKEELVRCLQLSEGAVRLGSEQAVAGVVERGVERLWEEIGRATTGKKYLLMEALLEWARKYGERIGAQWKVVVYLISKFHRSKSLRKDHPAKGSLALAVLDNKCYLYQSYVDALIARTAKFALPNLLHFLRALLAVSREETTQTGSPYSLEKISEVLELNSVRSQEVLSSFWGELREYYSELGRSKNQRVAMFAADFLKQLVTKLLKRKELMGLQREFLRPFEQIFQGTKIFAVKELMVGGLHYFVSNHPTHLRVGWRTILAVICACFQEEEHAVIKEKAYGLLRKIADSGFVLFPLAENYTDFVQILGRLAREKEDTYALGCLQLIKEVVEHYHKSLGIDLSRAADAVQNAALDINFWQTVFLPLLSIIYPICGDSRTNIQLPAIENLFDILVRYGKLFKYEFWKMVLQGVLRPAFEEITYTSQSKPLKKTQLEQWLKHSFSLLFRSINQLIVLYYDDFRLFLEDVFKIYENCILNHSLKLLIGLSLEALNELLVQVAPHFQPHDWETYLAFAQSLLKKTLPVEISSLQAWNRSKDLLENNYEAKCFALFQFLSKAQEIYEKFPESITEQVYCDTLKELDPIHNFVSQFNDNLELRDALWKTGFYQEIKMLPGLIKHHYEIQRFRCRILLRLSTRNPVHIGAYYAHILSAFSQLKQLRLTEYQRDPTARSHENERLANNYRCLLLDTILDQLLDIGSASIAKTGLTEQLLRQALDLMGNRVYCPRCQSCENCENGAENARLLNDKLQKLVLMLFRKE